MPSELPLAKASLHLASSPLATLPQQPKLPILLNIAFLRKPQNLIVQATSAVSCLRRRPARLCHISALPVPDCDVDALCLMQME